MKKATCPSCGAAVVFRSSLSVYVVCAYCKSMIVRRDVDVDSIGIMAALPDDMSPLQIGTTGNYSGTSFTIIGRIKIGWEHGVWNEWFLHVDDGRRGWLAEAQGSYGVSFEVDYAFSPDSSDNFPENSQMIEFGRLPAIGCYILLNHQRFKVVDVKRSTCIGSEGELPFIASSGRQTVSADLLGPAGEFASIEVVDGKSRVYVGAYVEWDDLGCQNLRPLEGW